MQTSDLNTLHPRPLIPSWVTYAAVSIQTSGLQPVVRNNILMGMQKLLLSIKTKHRNRLNLEPALILALTKICPRIEVLACQKQAQSSH
jgi:hypothetical protein